MIMNDQSNPLADSLPDESLWRREGQRTRCRVGLDQALRDRGGKTVLGAQEVWSGGQDLLKTILLAPLLVLTFSKGTLSSLACGTAQVVGTHGRQWSALGGHFKILANRNYAGEGSRGLLGHCYKDGE